MTASNTYASRSIARLALALLSAGVALPASAQSVSDRFEFHGYGFQDYTQTTANTFLGADRHGTWDNNFLGLVMAATLSDESRLWAQFQGSSNVGTRFTWFFVDYQVNDALRLHVGRVKLPLGLYNEIIDAKPLHLAALEPSLYQIFRTGADMVHDAYQGVGADFEQDIGAGHLRWQAWGGNVYDVDPPDDSRDRRAWGGRITYDTPIDGLRFMLSGYRTRVELLDDHAMTSEDRVIVSADYTHHPWDVKAEYAWHRAALHAGAGNVDSYAWYLQAGYTMGKWTPYARYDYVTTDKSLRADPSYHQHTLALGLGYQVNPNIGLRVENHFNRGYALPVSTGEVEPGAGSRRWNQLVAAINFKF